MLGASPRYCAVHNEDPCVTCAIYPAHSVSYTLVPRPARAPIDTPPPNFARDTFRRVRADGHDPGDEDA